MHKLEWSFELEYDVLRKELSLSTNSKRSMFSRPEKYLSLSDNITLGEIW
jgi:hypothetical protein